MARLITYKRDDTISENDFVIGTDSETKLSKNFVLGNLRTFMNIENSISFSFEYYSKNLKQYPYTIEYDTNVMDKIIYTTPNGFITKTFVYLSNKLDRIILSGDIDASIDKTKKFNYTGNQLTSINYY